MVTSLDDFLIFFDENTDENIIFEIKNQKEKIISFDVNSHHILSENNIEHDLIENYFSNDEISLIEDYSLNFAQTWYKENDFQKILVFDELNLGKIIETPLYLFMIQKLKKIFGIKKILENKTPKQISANKDLILIVQKLDNENVVTKKVFSETLMNKNIDKVILPVSIGKKSYNFWISKNFAIKTAKIIESFSNIFYGLKFDFNNKEPSVVLLDLNPKPYELLTHELSKISKNIIFMKDMGPISWNKENIRIIKNSKSKILGLDNFRNKSLDNIIETKQDKFTHDFSLLCSKILSKLSFDELLIWNMIENEFLEICIKHFCESIKVKELSEIFFKKLNITTVLTLYNSNTFQQTFLHCASKHNIKCIRLQHGFDPLNEYLKKFVPLSIPDYQTNLKHGLWGMPSKKYLVSSKFISDDQTIVLGNPRYDQLLKIKKQLSASNNIILASSFTYTGFDLSGFDSAISEEHKKSFADICTTVKKFNDKNLIVKFHPGVKTSYNVQPILNKINSDIPVFKTQNIFELLKTCELLICMDFSTIILEALILGIPVIVFMINPHWYRDDELFLSNSVISVETTDELENAITSVLYDKSIKTELIQKGNDFVEKHLSNLGTSSKLLKRIIDEN